MIVSLDPLNSFIGSLPKKIIEAEWKKQYKEIPDNSEELKKKYAEKAKDIEKRSKEAAEKYKKQAKEMVEQQKKAVKEKAEQAKQAVKDKVKEAKAEAGKRLREIKNHIKNFSSDLGHLAQGTVDLSIRVGSELASITAGAATIKDGTGIKLGIAQLKALRSAIKSDGLELAKTYTDCESHIEFFNTYLFVPGVSDMIDTATKILSTAKPLINLTGASV